jgi:hypothetical protein
MLRAPNQKQVVHLVQHLHSMPAHHHWHHRPYGWCACAAVVSLLAALSCSADHQRSHAEHSASHLHVAVLWQHLGSKVSTVWVQQQQQEVHTHPSLFCALPANSQMPGSWFPAYYTVCKSPILPHQRLICSGCHIKPYICISTAGQVLC